MKRERISKYATELAYQYHRHKMKKHSNLTVFILASLTILAFALPHNTLPTKAFSYELVENGLIGACGKNNFNGTPLTSIQSFDLKDQYLIINARDKIVILNADTLEMVKIIDEVSFPNGTIYPVTRLGNLELIRFDVDGTFYVTAFHPTNSGIYFAYHMNEDGHILHSINLTKLGIRFPLEILPHSPFLIVVDSGFRGPSLLNSSIKYDSSRLVYLQLNDTPLQVHEFRISIPNAVASRLNEIKKSLNDHNITISLSFNTITRTSQTPNGFGVLFNVGLEEKKNQSNSPSLLYSSFFIQLYNERSSNETSNNTMNANASEFFQLTTEYQLNTTRKLNGYVNLFNVLFFDMYGKDKAIMTYFGRAYVFQLQPPSDFPLIGMVDVLAGKEVGHEIKLYEVKVERDTGKVFMLDFQETQCLYSIIITDLTPENFTTGKSLFQKDDEPLWQAILTLIIFLFLPLNLAYHYPIPTAAIVILTMSSIIALRHPRIKKRLHFTERGRGNDFEFGELPNSEQTSSLDSALDSVSDSRKEDEEF